MVLPKLDISVRFVLKFINKAKRRAVLFDRHDCAGGEIQSETDDVLRINSALL